MTKKIFWAAPFIATFLMSATPALAAGEEAAMAQTGGFGLVIKLVTLILVGIIIYSLWVGLSQFGGTMGSALKTIGLGILFISLHVLDEVLTALTGFGSEKLLAGVMSHDDFHALMALAGFVVLAVGLTKMTKVVKTMKG